MVEYRVLDVFTDTPFGGNPLAVILDSSALAEANLQKIAAEFGFSETVFLYPPKDPRNDARVRIFTPISEIPFAGHPIIGSAVVLGSVLGKPDLALELGVGPIKCKVSGGPPAQAEFTTHTPLEILADLPLGAVADCLSLQPKLIKTTHHRPQIASVGMPFVLVHLKDTGTVSRASPILEAIRQAKFNFAPDTDFFAIFLYARSGSNVFARMFAPLENVPEDPATGAASAALAAYLCNLEGRDLTLDIRQGVDMGRPSRITARAQFGVGDSNAVTISGQAVEIMRGQLCCFG